MVSGEDCLSIENMRSADVPSAVHLGFILSRRKQVAGGALLFFLISFDQAEVKKLAKRQKNRN